MGLLMSLYQIKQEQLDAVLRDPETLFDVAPLYRIDIDKSWDDLRFLFSQIDHRVPKLISREKEYEGFEFLEESGLYDINFVSHQEVKELVIALNTLSEEKLQKAFDRDTMNEEELYAAPFDEHSFSYLKGHFERLKAFYTQASNENNAVITFIS